MDAGPPTSDCPPRATWEQVVAGAGPEDADLASHLERCASCRELVERIAEENALLQDFVAANAEALRDEEATDRLPRIAGYELIEEIHRGAQGVVYRAVQTRTKRPVAVKTLMHGALATTRQRHRFEREVELIASLRHPGIVTIFESGRTGDGGDYLAMELVEGETLDRHLEAHGRAPADAGELRRRLRLIADVCDAVNAAHRRGIIHRDLKPQNILVDGGGAPRVLDFGLAKRHVAEDAAHVEATVAGEFLGTFAYAAPEQVSGNPNDVDVRSDVYALGAILYETVTGQRPYGFGESMADVVDAIRHAEPGRPRQLCRLVDRDVETIALRALAKDPDRRYQSAGALRDDLGRALDGRPIEARADSRWYVLGKTLSRYRVPVAVGGGALLLTLLFALAITWQADEARQHREAATDRLTMLVGLLGSEQLRERSDEQTMRRLFAEADAIFRQLDDQPEAAAPVREQLGLAQLDRGYYEDALAQLERALDLRLEVSAQPSDQLADAYHNCGRALWWCSRYEEAGARYRQALDLKRALHGDEHETVAQTLLHLAATERSLGHPAAAEGYLRDALAVRRRLLGPGHPDVAEAQNNLGVLLYGQRRFAEALELFQGALDVIEDVPGVDERTIAGLLHNLGSCHVALEHLDRARELLESSLRLKARHLDDTHPSIASTRLHLARVAMLLDELDEAERLCRLSLAACEQAYPSGHPAVADALVMLGRILLRRGLSGDAETAVRRALSIRHAETAPVAWRVAEANGVLGACLLGQGRDDDARPLLAMSYQTLLETLGPEDPLTAEAAERLSALRAGSEDR